MDVNNDLEKEILMEMEQHIAKGSKEALQKSFNSVSLSGLANSVVDAYSTSSDTENLEDEIKERLMNRKLKKKVREQARLEQEEQARRVAAQQTFFDGEERARLEVEEQARLEAEKQAIFEAEERVRLQAEEQAQRKAEEQARRQEEQQAFVKAEEEARLVIEEDEQQDTDELEVAEAEERASCEAEEQARREAEEQARREAEKQVFVETEEQERLVIEEDEQQEIGKQAHYEAEQRERLVEEEKARLELEELERREEERQALSETQLEARRVIEEDERREAVEQALIEAEERECCEAEEQARREAEEEARCQAEQHALKETEEEARLEIEEDERQEAEEQVLIEYEERLQREAEERARREAEEQARREAEEQARREAEEQARREAEEQAQREAEEQARREAEEQAQREAEEQARREAEEQARREAEEQARREAEEQAQREAEEQARREAEEIARQEAKEKLLREAQAKGRREGQEKARREFEEKARREAEEKQKKNLENNTSAKKREISGEVQQEHGAGVIKPSGIGGAKELALVKSSNGPSSRCSVGTKEEHLRSGLLDTSGNVLGYVKNPVNHLCHEFEDVVQDCVARGVSRSNFVPIVNLSLLEFANVCEPGLCFFPPFADISQAPWYVQQELKMFQLPQRIISPRFTSKFPEVGNSEVKGALPLSSLDLYFESEILLREGHMFQSDYKCNQPAEEVLSKNDILNPRVVNIQKVLSRVDYGDILSTWEKSSGFHELGSEGQMSPASLRHHEAPQSIWVSDINVTKPVALQKTFHGGRLLQIKATEIRSKVTKIHGEGTDPLLIAAAIFSISKNDKKKVSETFYFSADIDIFYPQHERHQKGSENRIVAYIPKEYCSCLYLVVRVFRPANYNFSTFCDLYYRPDKYKNIHVAPLKQETLLISKSSDVMQELGWTAVSIQAGDHSVVEAKKHEICRKPFSDKEIVNHVLGGMKNIANFQLLPVDLSFEISDLTHYEPYFPFFNGENPTPEERETVICLLNTDVPGAVKEVYRYIPSTIFIASAAFHTYINIFYLRFSYLKAPSAALSRYSPSTHTTYYISICFKTDDKVLNEDENILACIYGRGLHPLEMSATAISSCICMTSMDWSLSDEIKIQLPLCLTSQHHMLLTLYSCYPKPGPVKPPVKVGYAVIPLFKDNALCTTPSSVLDFIACEHEILKNPAGYLKIFEEAQKSHYIHEGKGLLHCSYDAKSTVYTSNTVLGRLFSSLEPSIQIIKEDNDVLETGTNFESAQNPRADILRVSIQEMGSLGLPQILTEYPLICSYALSIIGSPAAAVSISHRAHALDILVCFTTKLENYERSFHSGVKNASTKNEREKTSAERFLYHYFSNDPLCDGEEGPLKWRLYSGMAEAWLALLPFHSSPQSPKPTKERNVLRELHSISWFLFDIILKSAYFWAEKCTPEGLGSYASRKSFHPHFYDVLSNLCIEVIRTLSVFDESTVVKRVALFIRNLMHCADRGKVLGVYSSIVHYFLTDDSTESLTNFLSYILEDSDVALLFLYSQEGDGSSFLAPMILDSFSTMLLHRNKDTRVPAVSVLYHFLRQISLDRRLSRSDLTVISGQLFPLVTAISSKWKDFMALHENTSVETLSCVEIKKVLLCLLWILEYAPVTYINGWLTTEENERRLAGFFLMITEAQAQFQYILDLTIHRDSEQLYESPDRIKWDKRLGFTVNSIAISVIQKSFTLVKSAIATVQRNPPSPCVFPFLLMLEGVLHLKSSTRTLQIGSSLLFEIMKQLLPEISGGKSKVCDGFFLILFRLMSSCCQYVRRNASMSFFFMCQVLYSWHHSFNRIKSMISNALVLVAESTSRNLSLAEYFVSSEFEALIDRAVVEEANYIPPSLDFNDRYVDDPSWTSGDALMEYNYVIEHAYTSVTAKINVPEYLQKNSPKEKPSRFSEEFQKLLSVSLHLFQEVLPLRVDNSMAFKEPQAATYFDIAINFLKQHSVKEALKWLYRLRDFHAACNNSIEAGQLLVLIAGIGFRVTELFYYSKGKATKGARFPVEILDYVYWHDFVRIFPSLDTLLSEEILNPIAAQLYVVPDDPCFTLEGQIKLLKEAAEHQDKDFYYELSLQTIHIVDKYVRAAKDYSGAAVLHRAMASWCSHLAKPRETNTYFLLWARMEKEDPLPPKARSRNFKSSNDDPRTVNKTEGLPLPSREILRVYKEEPKWTLENFKNYAKKYVSSLFPSSAMVVLTDKLTTTEPLSPEKAAQAHTRNRTTPSSVAPNHCLLTVFQVFPYISDEKPKLEDGEDKNCLLQIFRRVFHDTDKSTDVNSISIDDVPHLRRRILTYELKRPFPSITTTIDVQIAKDVYLTAVETAAAITKETIRDILLSEEDIELIRHIRDALTIHGLRCGPFFKSVILSMGHKKQINSLICELLTVLKEKVEVWKTLEGTNRYPESYAGVVKAIADMECALIAYTVTEN